MNRKKLVVAVSNSFGWDLFHLSNTLQIRGSLPRGRYVLSFCNENQKVYLLLERVHYRVNHFCVRPHFCQNVNVCPNLILSLSKPLLALPHCLVATGLEIFLK